MHKNVYKIKAGILCNKNFNNSINELKPFLGFDLNEIQAKKEANSINFQNEVLIVDYTYIESIPINEIKIPTILLLKKNERNKLQNKFSITMTFPLSIIQFNRTVIDICQKFKFDKNSVIKVKEYILDKNSRYLKRNKNFVKVTEKEMHFIEELNNSPTPLTKDYILKNIWGYSSETDTHTVETHIYRLRQKIKNHFNDKNFIKHTNDGYSL